MGRVEHDTVGVVGVGLCSFAEMVCRCIEYNGKIEGWCIGDY